MAQDFMHVEDFVTPPGCQGAYLEHSHDYHEFLYCFKGNGGQWGPSGELKLEEGDLFFYPAGVKHRSLPIEGHAFHCTVVDFSSTLFSPAADGDRQCIQVLDLLTDRRGRPVKIKREDQHEFYKVLQTIREEFQNKEAGYLINVKANLMRALVMAARNSGRGFDKEKLTSKQIVDQALQFIDAYYMHDIDIETILKFCPISRSHFHAMFKKYTNSSFVTYLIETRMKKAKEWLESDIPVSEVSTRCGFKSHSRFCQVFKKEFGVTPLQYRETRKVS